MSKINGHTITPTLKELMKTWYNIVKTTFYKNNIS